MVRALRDELGLITGPCSGRVARQLGYGTESVRSWVRQADIDHGHASGVSTSESARVKDFEQAIRELKRANAILKRAASFFGAELVGGVVHATVVVGDQEHLVLVRIEAVSTRDRSSMRSRWSASSTMTSDPTDRRAAELETAG